MQRPNLKLIPVPESNDISIGSGNAQFSGGPPYNGDMEARIDKLETFAERTGERLTRVEEKLDTVLREVGQFKWWLVGAILTIILTVFGTGVAIQQMTVATFQGASQVAKDAAPAVAPQSLPPIIINVPSQQQPVSPQR